jgi:glycosyltransferase involved in cell wall biosynthesis
VAAEALVSAALYVCYLGVDEPLVATQVLPYLRALASRGYSIHLLTFETARRSEDERERISDALRAQGITWHALRYHRWPSLPATLYDIARGALRALRIARRHGVRLVHARSHVGAAVALPLDLLAGVPFLFDVRGLLPDEYADAGHWRRGGLKYRLGKAMERVFFRRAKGLVFLTETIRADLRASDPLLASRDGDVAVIPCCVDLEAYAIPESARAAYRAERGWTDRRVIVYVGKLGMWYLDAEMARFFAAARALDPRLRLEVLTPSPSQLLVSTLAAAGVPAEAFAVRRVSPSEVPAVLAAADAGLSFIRPCFSKRSSSPTKVGEYLAAGLPVVSTAGIGDCDQMLSGGRGVLLQTLDDEAYRRAARELGALLDDPATARRCRAFAEAELSLDGAGAPRYAAVYERLLRAAEVR